jgi:hypothetical protein
MDLLQHVVGWVHVSWVVAAVLVTALGVLLLVPLWAAAGAGLSSPSDALYLKIAVEAVPLGRHALVLVDVSLPSLDAPRRVAFGGLSHSALYETPGAIAAVLVAIENFDRARTARVKAAPSP